MAFSYPLALHFPPIPRYLLPQIVDNVLAAMRSNHRVPTRFCDLAAELVFEKFSGEWLDTIEMSTDYPSAGEAVGQGKWLRLSFELRITSGFYVAELYVFPIPDKLEMGGIQLNFDGRVYAALYEYQSRISGKFDEELKRDLLKICFKIASVAEAEALILLPEDGSFKSISLPEILDRLLNPQMELYGRRAGLITGVRESVLQLEEIRQVWCIPVNDPRLITTTHGYSVLDLLQPLTEL